MKTRRRNNAFHPLSLIKRTRWSACVCKRQSTVYSTWNALWGNGGVFAERINHRQRYCCSNTGPPSLLDLYWQSFTRKLNCFPREKQMQQVPLQAHQHWRNEATCMCRHRQFNITVQWGCRGKNKLVRWPYSWLLLWPMKVIKHLWKHCLTPKTSIISLL